MTNATSRGLLRRLTTVVTGALTLALAVPAAAQAYESGIDVSKWQHVNTSVDWTKVKSAGVDFAFIKATEDTSYTNPYFAGDWAATTRLGIYRGAYHFARPRVGTAAAQASYFIKVAGKAGYAGDLPPVLDLESNGGLTKVELRAWVRNFLVKVEDLTGRVPIIYCSPSFWDSNVADSTFGRYPLWIAHYTTAAQPRLPMGWSTWTFWQNTSSGSVSGVSGNVDKDRFNGTLTQLKAFAQTGATPAPPPPPAPTPTPTPTGPAVATTTTITSSAPSVLAGRSVTFNGTVVSGSPAKPAAGATVALSRRLAGSTDWVRLTTVTADALGNVSVPSVVTQQASYRFRVLATSAYLGSYSPIVPVSLMAPTTVTATPTASGAYAGRTVTIGGTLAALPPQDPTSTSPLPGRTVTLDRLLPGTTTWTTLTTATTGDGGSFAVPVVVDRTASYRVRAAGDTAYAPATSKTVAVQLIPPAATRVSLAATPTRFRAGSTVAFRGHLVASTDAGTVPVGGRRVVVWRHRSGTTGWQFVRSVITDASGGWAVSTPVWHDVTYQARFTGGVRYAGALSHVVTLHPLAR